MTDLIQDEYNPATETQTQNVDSASKKSPSQRFKDWIAEARSKDKTYPANEIVSEKFATVNDALKLAYGPAVSDSFKNTALLKQTEIGFGFLARRWRKKDGKSFINKVKSEMFRERLDKPEKDLNLSMRENGSFTFTTDVSDLYKRQVVETIAKYADPESPTSPVAFQTSEFLDGWLDEVIHDPDRVNMFGAWKSNDSNENGSRQKLEGDSDLKTRYKMDRDAVTGDLVHSKGQEELKRKLKIGVFYNDVFFDITFDTNQRPTRKELADVVDQIMDQSKKKSDKFGANYEVSDRVIKNIRYQAHNLNPNDRSAFAKLVLGSERSDRSLVLQISDGKRGVSASDYIKTFHNESLAVTGSTLPAFVELKFADTGYSTGELGVLLNSDYKSGKKSGEQSASMPLLTNIGMRFAHPMVMGIDADRFLTRTKVHMYKKTEELIRFEKSHGKNPVFKREKPKMKIVKVPVRENPDELHPYEGWKNIYVPYEYDANEYAMMQEAVGRITRTYIDGKKISLSLSNVIGAARQMAHETAFQHTLVADKSGSLHVVMSPFESPGFIDDNYADIQHLKDTGFPGLANKWVIASDLYQSVLDDPEIDSHSKEKLLQDALDEFIATNKDTCWRLKSKLLKCISLERKDQKDCVTSGKIGVIATMAVTAGALERPISASTKALVNQAYEGVKEPSGGLMSSLTRGIVGGEDRNIRYLQESSKPVLDGLKEIGVVDIDVEIAADELAEIVGQVAFATAEASSYDREFDSADTLTYPKGGVLGLRDSYDSHGKPILTGVERYTHEQLADRVLARLPVAFNMTGVDFANKDLFDENDNKLILDFVKVMCGRDADSTGKIIPDTDIVNRFSTLVNTKKQTGGQVEADSLVRTWKDESQKVAEDLVRREKALTVLILRVLEYDFVALQRQQDLEFRKTTSNLANQFKPK